MAFWRDGWVWVSTEESRAADKVSILAIAEVIFSVAAYWWIALTFDTYLHLIVSIALAPLVLIRSPESVALGVKMFLGYVDNMPDVPLNYTKGMAFIVLAGLVSLVVCWIVSQAWLEGREGWPLQWRATLIGLLGINVGVAAAAAVAGAGGGAATAAVAVMGAAAAAVAVAVTGAGAAAAAGAAAVAIVGAVLVAVAGAGAGAGMAAVIGPGFAAGILSRALITRMVASLTFLWTGLAQLPLSWRQALFVSDIANAPEIVPEIGEKKPELTAKSWFAKIRSQVTAERITALIFIPIIFLPSLIYRYSLKSTCWLYFPFIYIATAPVPMRSADERFKWAASQAGKRVEWVRMLLACFTLLVFTAGIAIPMLAEQRLPALLISAGLGEVPISIFSLILVLDWGAIHLHPWQFFTLPSAVITLVLFFWLDAIGKDVAAERQIPSLGWQSRMAFLLDRARTVLVTGWLLIAFGYAMHSFHAERDTHPAAQWVLDQAFGACTKSS